MKYRPNRPRAGTLAVEDDTAKYGYHKDFERTQRALGSFAISFSQMSVTTGIFTTFGFLLATGGPRGIWTWVIVAVGQALVVLIYGALAARIPLSGYSYQWGSRLSNPHVGWWLGWGSFLFLTIVTPAVAYGFVQVALQPLLGLKYSLTSTALEAVVVMIVWGLLIIFSTKLTTHLNNIAVVTEIIGLVGLAIGLTVVAAIKGAGDWGNVVSTGTVSSHGYFSWLGPFMLSGLLAAFTLVGFESASSLAEETQDAKRVVPRAMRNAMIISSIVGMLFLISLSYATGDIGKTTSSSAPVAFIISSVLGDAFEKIFLVFICFSMFACGLMCMINNTRLIWAMARDDRLPGSKLWSRVPKPTGGPNWATGLVVSLGVLILIVLAQNADALSTLFTTSSLIPPLVYLTTVLIYAFRGRKLDLGAGLFSLGKWQPAVLTGALIWLAYEFAYLYLPSQFSTPRLLVIGSVVIGGLIYGYQYLRHPESLRHNPTKPANASDLADALEYD